MNRSSLVLRTFPSFSRKTINFVPSLLSQPCVIDIPLNTYSNLQSSSVKSASEGATMPGRARGAGRGGRGAHGGVRSGPLSKEVKISKALSYVLRHNAEKEGIELDEGGWANVQDIVSLVLFDVLYLRVISTRAGGRYTQNQKRTYCACYCFLQRMAVYLRSMTIYWIC